ncbi:MAG: GNAT family N-acetyltransferase [Coriobacteriales bacterium]|nr:GNAT family N-acetyltransferase [Coriobacteriales bacterium]
MSITLGQATLADTDELVQLRLAYLEADFGELTADQKEQLPLEIRPYLARHMGSDLLVFVARGDKSEGAPIVSCAWLLLVEKPPSPRFPHGKTGVLFNVYTAPSSRRQGIASRVMRELIEQARELKLDVLELHATDEGYPLYLSLGFVDDSSTHDPMRMML